MSARFLFITSHYFLQPTRQVLERIQPDCITQVLPYDDFGHIVQVYLQNMDNFDACFVSGIGAKTAIELAVPNITKPLVHFQVSANALHRDILRLAVKKQSLDFSRIVMDFLCPLDTGCTVADYLAIEDLSFVNVRTPEWMRSHAAYSGNALESLIIDKIRNLWEAGSIDLVICQYSSIVPALQQLGIPYHCPFLGEAPLKAMIDEMLLKLELTRLHDNHPAIVQVFPRHMTHLNRTQIQHLHKLLDQFIHANLMECVLQDSKTCCSLVTSMRTLRFLTNGFQDCRISAYLEDKLEFPISVGYGIGINPAHAMNNVQIASKEAKLLGKPFVVDTNGNLIGPLNSEARMVITPQSMPDISQIAKQCSLSAMTIQKLMAILRSNGSDKITTQDLALKMNTTIRNANRIMLNLCKGNIAKPIYTQTSHSRGRPIQVYALDFGFPIL